MQLTSRLVNTSENSSRLCSAHCRNATAEATIRAAGSSAGWASRARRSRRPRSRRCPSPRSAPAPRGCRRSGRAPAPSSRPRWRPTRSVISPVPVTSPREASTMRRMVSARFCSRVVVTWWRTSPRLDVLTGSEFTPLTVNAVHYSPEEFPCCTAGQRSSSAGRVSCSPSAARHRPRRRLRRRGLRQAGPGRLRRPELRGSAELAQEQEVFGNKSVDVVAIYTSKDLTVSDPAFKARGRADAGRHPGRDHHLGGHLTGTPRTRRWSARTSTPRRCSSRSPARARPSSPTATRA